MYRKIIPILIISLLITSIAFGYGFTPKVFIGNQEVKSTVVNGEVYIPVSELGKLNVSTTDFLGTIFIKPKANTITDIDTAYQVLTELHNRFLERLKNSSASTKEDNIKLLQKNSEETFYDLIKLNSIQIEPFEGIATTIFVTKNYLHTSLLLYFQATNDTLNGLQNNDKYAKKEIETIKPTFELIGKYTELSFKRLDEDYKKYKEGIKQ